VQKSREQQLVDILFEVAFKIRHNSAMFICMSDDDFAASIRHALNGSGFKTEPMGCSWAVLTEGEKNGKS
jgi:hypothetical protein